MNRRPGPTLAVLVFAVLLVPCAALAATTVTTAPTGEGDFTVRLQGSSGPDQITIEGPRPGIDGTGSFFYITDPQGVTGGVPPCFRFSETQIHCPAEVVGAFEIDLGAGNDILTVEGEFAEQTGADGGEGDDELEVGDGDDDVTGGGGDDEIDLGGGNDSGSGGAGNDTVSGGTGNDSVSGGAGNDRLNGGAGRDRLRGESGRDRISGGGGRDRISGGPARDRCVRAGKDRLVGCER
jgi:Ca2+-binding RTX toxin-like protein